MILWLVVWSRQRNACFILINFSHNFLFSLSLSLCTHTCLPLEVASVCIPALFPSRSPAWLDFMPFPSLSSLLHFCENNRTEWERREEREGGREENTKAKTFFSQILINKTFFLVVEKERQDGCCSCYASYAQIQLISVFGREKKWWQRKENKPVFVKEREAVKEEEEQLRQMMLWEKNVFIALVVQKEKSWERRFTGKVLCRFMTTSSLVSKEERAKQHEKSRKVGKEEREKERNKKRSKGWREMQGSHGKKEVKSG